MKLNCVVVDLETTGLDPKTDKIIEIGALKIREGEVVDTFSAYVNPARKLEERITELTGIRDKDLEDALYIEEILPSFLEFAGEDDLLGHSVIFDFSFLKRAFVNQKMSFERKGIDTLRIARRHLADLESRSLPFLCKHFQITHNPHRALSDVEATYELYKRLYQDFYKEELSEEEKKIFAPQPLIYQVKREKPATLHQKERLKKLIQYYKLVIDRDLDKMTRNEMSRFTDQILSQYGRPGKDIE